MGAKGVAVLAVPDHAARDRGQRRSRDSVADFHYHRRLDTQAARSRPSPEGTAAVRQTGKTADDGDASEDSETQLRIAESNGYAPQRHPHPPVE
jgi:hypothetical protein